VLQLGVYLQELASAATQPGCVGISENARRYNPFIRRVIPNGVDTTVFRPDPQGKTPEPSVLFVGALEGRKRGKLLMDWFARDVRPRFPTATLSIVSPPGPSAPGVSYHTGVSTEELAAMYRRAWVYATPSTYEGFGLPYVEAMACGTPVVATPNPGSREVLEDGRYARLVGDAEFGRAVADLLDDSDARRDLTERGLQRAREFSAALMIDRYEQLLFEVRASRSGAGNVS
jgi:glycosyltransferase involved in cell wall biosynthesis